MAKQRLKCICRGRALQPIVLLGGSSGVTMIGATIRGENSGSTRIGATVMTGARGAQTKIGSGVRMMQNKERRIMRPIEGLTERAEQAEKAKKQMKDAVLTQAGRSPV